MPTCRNSARQVGRAFSGAVISVALTMFGMFGSLFLLTQYMQFGLGYSARRAQGDDRGADRGRKAL
jgi:hypothetical protein